MYASYHYYRNVQPRTVLSASTKEVACLLECLQLAALPAPEQVEALMGSMLTPHFMGGGGADWQTPQSGSSREGLNTGGIVVSYAAKSIAVIVSDPDGHVSETYSDESL